MPANYVKKGDVITTTAAAALTSGQGFLIGSLFGVAQTAAAVGGTVEAGIVGVYTLPKETPLVITQGDPVYWDSVNLRVDKTSSNTLIGVCETSALSAATTVRVRLNSGYYPALDESVLRTADVTLTASQVKALYTTPIEVVAAPGAGKANVLVGLLLFIDFETAAYDGIASGEDFVLKYTNSSGDTILTVETDPLFTATADAVRWAPAPTTLVTPVANAAIVAHILSGNIATGDSPVKLRVFYRTIPTTL